MWSCEVLVWDSLQSLCSLLLTYPQYVKRTVLQRKPNKWFCNGVYFQLMSCSHSIEDFFKLLFLKIQFINYWIPFGFWFCCLWISTVLTCFKSISVRSTANKIPQKRYLRLKVMEEQMLGKAPISCHLCTSSRIMRDLPNTSTHGMQHDSTTSHPSEYQPVSVLLNFSDLTGTDYHSDMCYICIWKVLTISPQWKCQPVTIIICTVLSVHHIYVSLHIWLKDICFHHSTLNADTY